MINNNSRLSMSAFEFASPARPVPRFLQEPSFSQKKHLGATPRDSHPPHPPYKSQSSVSRLFPHKSRTDEDQPRNISFRQTENSILQSPHYNHAINVLYFDQCFRIEQRLGAGSFGEVFKVLNKADGKHYAVKRSRERFKGESDKRRKLEEVKKHESLSEHPNCVKFYTAWAERGHLYIQTELCQMSLQAYAERNHNIPESVVWGFLVDLIQGLHHMHEHGLLHLDIKPENIFVSFDGVCKLGDFGLSVAIGEVDDADTRDGDSKYLAPELLQGHFGKHADVFSLGITVLELASDLDLPQNGDLWHDLRNDRIPWQLTAGISPELRGIITSMMSPDFQKRPTLSALRETSMVQRTIAWQRRKRILHGLWHRFIGCLILLTALIAGLISKLMTPLRSFHGNQRRDEVDVAMDKPRHPSEWDLSFSDDEIFESDVSHSSLGVPLGSLSFSSEEDPSSVPHGRPANNSASFQMPATPRHIQTYRGPTPRSSSPIATGLHPTRSSPYCSPNVSLIRTARKTRTPSRTPRGTPSKLNFSSTSEESDSERKSMAIELRRSLSMEFEQLEDESD